MNDAVLTVQRIMSSLDILQGRPEREGFAVLSFQPGQPKAAWVCYGGERVAALEAGYRMLGHAAEFWVQDIAETLSWGPAAVEGEVEYQSWALHAAPQPAADERVAEHMRLVQTAVDAFTAWCDGQSRACGVRFDAAFAAVESSARALLAAGLEDAEHAAMYRWFRLNREVRATDGTMLHVYDEEGCVLYGDELDAAIRTAMQKGTP